MKSVLITLLLSALSMVGQNTIPTEFTYNEYLGQVKKFHPLVKTANLEISMAQANLLKARGSFDPKIEVDFSKKQFKDNEYYSFLNGSFKIPTWYGIEVKAGFDNSEGIFLNPENTMPNQGLTSLGITVPIGQGLFINQRMADLRKAKLQVRLSREERKLMAIAVLYDASVAYFNWKRSFNEVKLYENFAKNAQIRFEGVKTLIVQGDEPAIDSVEAGIILRNRLLSLEDATLKLAKAKLELSNYLWLDNSIPVELSDALTPEENLENTIQETLKTNDLLTSNFSINNHPKINALQSKVDILNVDRRLKANSLLPRIDLGYTYLSEPSAFDNYRFEDYKIGMNFYFPLFLRKERGDLKMAKFKLQETTFALELERVQLTNKIKAQQTEIVSLEKQRKFIKDLVSDSSIMLTSEERLFSFGESSIFLINSRENNLISAQLAAIAIENRYFVSNSELFRVMANPD